MLMRAIVFAAVVQGSCFVTTALCAELVANFDSFPEGGIGTSFTDGGIVFSELQIDPPELPPLFIIEDSSADPLAHQSLPNLLTSGGHGPGPGFGIGRFRSMTITFPAKASRASVDVFTPLPAQDVINTLTLSALLDDVTVATTSRTLSQGTLVTPFIVHHDLSITATQFNKLKLLVTTPGGTPGASLIAWDNVRIQLVPEPQSILLLPLGVIALLAKHRHRARAAQIRAGDPVIVRCAERPACTHFRR